LRTLRLIQFFLIFFEKWKLIIYFKNGNGAFFQLSVGCKMMPLKEAVKHQIVQKLGFADAKSPTIWGDAKTINEKDLVRLSRSHLRRHLKARSESSNGTKKKLIYRLQQSLESEKREIDAEKRQERAKHKKIAELEETGAVYSIGSNHKGQLGLGDLEHRGIFTVIPETRGIRVRNVAARNDTVFAVTEDNFVYCWGGGVGPMGLKSNKERLKFESPQLVEDLNGNGIIHVAIGSNHSCALSDGGDLYVWGNGQCGCLGQGDTENRPTPDLLMTLSDSTVIRSVEVGEMHNCALTQNGELYTWGHSSFGRLGVGNHSRHDDGDEESKFVLTPSIVLFPAREKVKLISCGSDHTVAVTDSRVFSWGSGDGFRLGHGDVEDRSKPSEILTLTGLSVSDVSCGTWHCACVVVIPPFINCGRVYTWGSGFQGQLGQGHTSISKKPAVLSYFCTNHVLPQAVVCGSHHNAVITKETEMYTWGLNENGCLGHSIEEDFVSFSPNPGYCAGFGAIVNRIGRGFVESVACGRGFTIVCTSQYNGPSVELASKLQVEYERNKAFNEQSRENEKLQKNKEEMLADERKQRQEQILYLTSKRLCVLCEGTGKCSGFQAHSSKPSICRECGHSSAHHTIIVDDSNHKIKRNVKAGDIFKK